MIRTISKECKKRMLIKEIRSFLLQVEWLSSDTDPETTRCTCAVHICDRDSPDPGRQCYNHFKSAYASLLFSLSQLPTMRWLCVGRKSLQESDLDISPRTTNDRNVHDIPPDDLTAKPSPPSNNSGLPQMFSDAALYERVLSACPESLRNGFLFGTDDQALPKCLGGFNELIGRDLGDAERAITGRLATLSVNNWAEDAPDTSSEEEPGETSPDEDEGEKESPVPIISSLQEEPPSEPKLTPEEVVSLLEDEFGALAPPGEEKLLLEADAAFFRDVVILVSATLYISRVWLTFFRYGQGVVHVTTHRFTFHASLLSSQQDYDQKVIKSGSVLIHRKGLHRKKRVWMQLDNDMISTFPSSRDEDRIKPYRSILCLCPNYALVISYINAISQCPRSRKSNPWSGSDHDISMLSTILEMASQSHRSSLIRSKQPGIGETKSGVRTFVPYSIV